MSPDHYAAKHILVPCRLFRLPAPHRNLHSCFCISITNEAITEHGQSVGSVQFLGSLASSVSGDVSILADFDPIEVVMGCSVIVELLETASAHRIRNPLLESQLSLSKSLRQIMSLLHHSHCSYLCSDTRLARARSFNLSSCTCSANAPRSNDSQH